MSTARAYIGAGDVLINPYHPTTGVPMGWRYAGDSIKFEIKPNSELKEAESRGRDTAGQVLASVARQKPAEINITFRETNASVLQMAFSGELAVLNQASGSVTDETITFKAGGGGARLSKGNIQQAGFVLTSKPAGTSYTLTTDFTVNWRLGIVIPVPGSALATAIAADADGSLDFLVDFTHNAVSGDRVRGATRAQIKAGVILDGINQADGSPLLIEAWEAVLTVANGFDALADDWAGVELTGRMNTPVGKTEPFVVDQPVFA